MVKYGDAVNQFHQITSRVPQDSVLGPTLYFLYTADLPMINSIIVAIFADDTALLAAHQDPVEASKLLQKGLDAVQNWTKMAYTAQRNQICTCDIYYL